MERRANSQAKAKVLRFATFWRSVFETLSGILNHKIDPDPLVALFGVIPEELQLPVAKTFLTQLMSVPYAYDYKNGQVIWCFQDVQKMKKINV